ncbi:MAG: hypothetical protein NZ874_09380 [Fimbriimonadales bacterium]|nr:hypothetical protein [Fimbriimonadales bacterium]
MPIIETVEELAEFLEQNDEWRRKLFNILIPRALQRLPNEVEQFREETRQEFAAVRKEMREGFERVDREMREGFERVDREFENVRQEMREGFERVDREMREGFERVDREFEKVRQEMREGFERVDREMREGFERVDREFEKVRQEMREGFERVDREMREGFERVDREFENVRQEMREGFEQMDRRIKKNSDDIAELKGITLEQRYRNHARSWFNKHLRNPRVVDMPDIEDRLAETQPLSESEREDLAYTDLFVIGLRRADQQETLAVVEISYVIDESDVERAIRRTQIVAQRGLSAAPVVAGTTITQTARAQAEAQNCAVLINGRFEFGGALETPQGT